MKYFTQTAGIFMITLLASGCWQNGQFGIRGEGPVVERKVNIDRFRNISIPGSAKVYITQGSQQEVRIEGQENIIDNLNMEVRGETWEIEFKRPVWRIEPIKVYITMESLRSVRISGSGDLEFVNHFTDLKDMDIRISGSGKMDMDMDALDIRAHISGSGDLYMKGSARDLDFTVSGSGNIKAWNLKADKASVRVSGSGGIEVNASDRLNAHISGSGNIIYRGNPRVDSSVSGSGSVRSRD
jgi:hypothetical protein